MAITLCETESSTILAPAQLAVRAEAEEKELKQALAISMVDTVHHTSRLV
jgi:hypothetical protein